eukprot:1147456-Amphidinium_carterae.1
MLGSHHAPAESDNPDPSVYSVSKSVGVGKFGQLIGNLTTGTLALPPPPKGGHLLPAPPLGLLLAHEPALVPEVGVSIVWTDGSGKHSSNPHFRRCG